MAEEPALQDNVDDCECKEFQSFRFTLRRIYGAVARGVSLQRFQELYGGILSGNQAKKVYQVLTSTMENGMLKDLEEGLEGDELNSKCKKLSEIIGSYDGEKDIKAWRPPGDVHLHLRSHLAAQKLKMKEDLEKFVNTGDIEISLTQQDIVKRRAAVKHLDEKISALIQMYEDHEKVDTFHRNLESLFDNAEN